MKSRLHCRSDLQISVMTWIMKTIDIMVNTAYICDNIRVRWGFCFHLTAFVSLTATGHQMYWQCNGINAHQMSAQLLNNDDQDPLSGLITHSELTDLKMSRFNKNEFPCATAKIPFMLDQNINKSKWLWWNLSLPPLVYSILILSWF